MDLDSVPPAGDAPWAGMSGAAVFCGELLAGVVAADPAGLRHAALEAIPAYVLLQDPGFVAALTEYAGTASVQWEAIEFQAICDTTARVVAGQPVRSPAALLSARRAIVPFHGREDVLAELHSWAARPDLGVWLLHGPGGQGKTRLAQEFADLSRHQGWATVWLAPTADLAGVQALAAVTTRTVVVVDYAENRTDQLAVVFAALPRIAPGVAVKVLLLARTAGAWWQELAATGGEVVRDVVELAQVRALPVLDPTPEARQVSYQVAVSAFAAALSSMGRPRQLTAASLPDPAPLVTGPASTVLAVQMAALADLLDSAPGEVAAGPGGGRGPEDRVLDHERGYWKSTAASRALLNGLSLETLTDVVIATVVLGTSTVDELDTVVARVPSMADQTADRRNAVRAWLTGVYPPGGDGTFEGLVPDRLAERLVGRSIQDAARPGVVERLAARADGDEAKQLLTVCVRAAAHSVLGAEVGDRVTRWCAQYAEPLAVAAVEVATRVETPAPLVRAIEQVTGRADTTTAALERMCWALPGTSPVLAEAAVKICQVLVERRRQALADDPDLDGSDLAQSLNNLSIRLRDLGRQEEGLAAVTEAVEVYRRLAEQHPDTFLSALATCLSNLSIVLGELGRLEDGLAAVTEAVEVFRRPAEQHPDAFLPDLARSLNNLSNRLGGLGRWEDGLAAITEAIEIRRRLAEQHPDAYLPDLAKSLNNLSVVLGGLGRREDGLAAITEAIEMQRRLAEQHPDAYLPDLASSSINLSNRLGDLGRWNDGLAPITEAVEVYRRLAEQHPDAYLPDLAKSLNNLAVVLGELGRWEDALAAITEAAGMRRRLAEQRPGAFLPDLAQSLTTLSNSLGGLSRREDALAAITEAVSVYRRQAEQHPEAHLPDLALSLINLSVRLVGLGHREQALGVITEAVEIYRTLASLRPDAFRHALAMSLNNLSVVLGALGHRDEALGVITEAIEIRRRLAQQRPEVHRKDLEQSLRAQAWLAGEGTDS